MNQNLPATQKNSALTEKKTTVPAVIFLAGGLAGVLLTHFTVVSILIMLTGLVLLISKALVKKSLEAGSEAGEQPLTGPLKDLRHQVVQAKYLKNFSALGEKLGQQVDQLNHNYHFVMKTMAQKFSPTELTYTRYEDAINDTVIKVMDKLKFMVSTLTSLDPAGKTQAAAAPLAEIENLLGLNQKALQELESLSRALAGINNGEVQNLALEDSLERLKQLAGQADLYSKKSS